MKIISYLNPTSKLGLDVRTIMKKYNLEYEENDITQKPNSHAREIPNSGLQLMSYIEINGAVLANINGKAVERYLLEEGLVESIDSKPQNAQFIDEESKVIRSEIIRFF